VRQKEKIMNMIRRNDPVAITLLVFLNLVTFLLQFTLIPTEYWAMTPLRLMQSIHTLKHVGHEIATLFTHQFLHAGSTHLLINMISLVFFGSLVERELGVRRFLTCYLASGVAGALGIWAFSADQTVQLIGASGGIAGVIGAFLILIIRRRAPLTILAALGGLFVLVWWLPDQLVGSMQMAQGTTDSHNGYLAHLFGFIAGVVLMWRYCSRSAASSMPIVDCEHFDPNQKKGR